MNLFFLFVVLSTFGAVWTLQCYNCNSKTQKDCAVITENSAKYLQNCTSNTHVGCKKQIQFTDFLLTGLKSSAVFWRVCSSSHDEKKPCYPKAGNGGKLFICTCVTEACNSSPKQFAVATVIGLLVLLSQLLRVT